MIFPDLPEALRAQLPILQIIVPMLSAPLCLLFRRSRLCWTWSMLVLWASFATSILILNQVVTTGIAIDYWLGDWSPVTGEGGKIVPIGIGLRIDTLNAFVQLIVTGISAVVLTAAPRSIESDIPRDRHYLFYAAYLLCMTGLSGMTVTGDAFNIFVFLEISALSSYVLISQGRTPRALTSALRYLLIGTLGGTFLLLGIGLLYMVTGTLNLADLGVQLSQIENVEANRTVMVGLACIAVGVSIKLALFPLHIWLPNTYFV